MKKEKIEIIFETITPIWTGDVNQECTELKPASIIGSLRFWFEIYCHFADIEVKEDESLDYKKFLEERKKDINKSEYKILKKLGISLPSIIFGCTGWKSRISIESINNEYEFINRDNFDYTFMFDDFSTEWWCNKILFKDKSQIKLFKNIQVHLNIDNKILEEFKKFLKFYEDKFILVGGKKSFGFGFTKIKSNLNFDDIKLDIKNKNYMLWENITINNKNKVLGFNFKYFLRKKENKKYRKNNFGYRGKASDYYFSNLTNNNIIVLTFNSNKIILDKYINFIINKNNKENKSEKSIKDLQNHFLNR